MKKFDQQEAKILRELIRNPRISDNQTAKNTKIPVTTVNRKRKLLEEDGFISYFCHVSDESFERGQHNARQIYIVKFKEGITRQKYIDEIKKSENFKKVNPRYHAESYLGEKDGRFAIIFRIHHNYIPLFNMENGIIKKDWMNEWIFIPNT